jgi:hypothetical protein
MALYPNLRARYSRGTLKLQKPLDLPEGVEVRVSVTVTPSAPRRPEPTKRQCTYPNRPLPSQCLRPLVGLVSLGGDALKDSEAIVDNP